MVEEGPRLVIKPTNDAIGQEPDDDAKESFKSNY